MSPAILLFTWLCRALWPHCIQGVFPCPLTLALTTSCFGQWNFSGCGHMKTPVLLTLLHVCLCHEKNMTLEAAGTRTWETGEPPGPGPAKFILNQLGSSWLKNTQAGNNHPLLCVTKALLFCFFFMQQKLTDKRGPEYLFNEWTVKVLVFKKWLTYECKWKTLYI